MAICHHRLLFGLLVLVVVIPDTHAGSRRSRVVVVTPVVYAGYSPDPYASVLTGLANLTDAQGRYWKQLQDAAAKREQVRRDKLETHKQQVRHLAWLRDFQIEQWE